MAKIALDFVAGVCFGHAIGNDESYLARYFRQPDVLGTAAGDLFIDVHRGFRSSAVTADLVAVFAIVAIYLVAMVYNGRQGKVEFEKSGLIAKAAGKVISLFTPSKTVKDADEKTESTKPARLGIPSFRRTWC